MTTTSGAVPTAMPIGRRLPERTCVGCRATRPKPELIRLVLPPEGAVEVDPTGRRSGRGAYICLQTGTHCLSQARRRRALHRALRTTAERIDADALAAALRLLAPLSEQSAAAGTRVGGGAAGLSPGAESGGLAPLLQSAAAGTRVGGGAAGLSPAAESGGLAPLLEESPSPR